MFTFGYKSKTNGLVKAIVALVAGVIMVAAPGQAPGLLVKIIAALMLIPGIVSLVKGVKNTKDGDMPINIFNAVVNILFAGALFIFNDFFANFIIYLIGGILLVFGAFQLIALISARRVIVISPLVLILPVVLTLIGVFILFNPWGKETMVIIAGVSMIIYGASELFSSWMMKKAIDEYETKQSQDTPQTPDETLDNAREVDYEKVDEQ